MAAAPEPTTPVSATNGDAIPAPSASGDAHLEAHEQKVTPWEVEGEVDESGKIKEIDYNVGLIRPEWIEYQPTERDCGVLWCL
jgi:hypothetical protein